MWATVGFPQDSVVKDSQNHFTVDLTDIPPIPDDDWMPPLNTLKWKVEFYYTYAHSAKEFWDNESKSWAKNAERFSNPSNQLKQAVSGIVAPSDSDEQKARKIYAAVMKLDNTRFSRTKSDAERKAEKLKPVKAAEDVWKQQSGTDDDMALLFVALGRAAGLKVWPMEVVDRSKAFFDPLYLTAGQLDDYIAILDLSGKETFLDPGQKMCPFGIMSWKHSLASGFRLSDKGPILGTTPQGVYKNALVQRTADLTVDPDGSVVARLSVDGAEFWLADESPEHGNASAGGDGASAAVRMILTVADPDAVFAQAIAADAREIYPVSESHGWRVGRIVDPFGHHREIGRQLDRE